jgi:branched-chain amino acid transport system ATP-binding protein
MTGLASEPAALVLSSVSVRFGGLTAVDQVSLTMAAGERRALIGPNGAGKTTLFGVISGELTATSGRVVVFGDDVTGLPPHKRAARGIARTFQIIRLFPNLTVMENALLACEALDRRKFSMLRPLSGVGSLVARAEQLLGEFGLLDRRAASTRSLPYGDRRKLEVALAMAGRPRLLLVDEPMAGLSAREREVMQGVLDRVDSTVAVLLIEHDMDVAFRFAERVTVLDRGRVLAEGLAEDIARNEAVQQRYLGVR